MKNIYPPQKLRKKSLFSYGTKYAIWYIVNQKRIFHFFSSKNWNLKILIKQIYFLRAVKMIWTWLFVLKTFHFTTDFLSFHIGSILKMLTAHGDFWIINAVKHVALACCSKTSIHVQYTCKYRIYTYYMCFCIFP